MDLLTGTTLIAGLGLLALGVFLVWNPVKAEGVAKSFPRSKVVASVTMTAATIWFLYRHVQHLTEADFGDYKIHIGIITVALLVLSFIYLPDFLAVRGTAVLVLFFAREALDSAFREEPLSRLFMVSAVYLGIVAALYLAAWPYRLRDFLDWLYGVKIRRKILGVTLVAYGLLLSGVAFGY